MARDEPTRRVKRSLILDADMAEWIGARAQAASSSESTIVRQLIRAAMNAEYRARTTDVDVEEG